jgi:hypothetical protein
MALAMKVQLLWGSHRVIWRQNTDGTEKASTFVVMVVEQITYLG